MNSRTGNKIFIDTTGVAVVTGPVKIAYIIFTPNAANDELTLRETADGNDCITIKGGTAKQTTLYRMSEVPLVFSNGIFVQVLSSNATATLVSTAAGG